MIVSHVHLELLLFMRNTGRERGRKGKREEEEEGRREGGGGREGGRERKCEREREREGGGEKHSKGRILLYFLDQSFLKPILTLNADIRSSRYY